jgi:hypothetical protein
LQNGQGSGARDWALAVWEDIVWRAVNMTVVFGDLQGNFNLLDLSLPKKSRWELRVRFAAYKPLTVEKAGQIHKYNWRIIKIQ